MNALLLFFMIFVVAITVFMFHKQIYQFLQSTNIPLLQKVSSLGQDRASGESMEDVVEDSERVPIGSPTMKPLSFTDGPDVIPPAELATVEASSEDELRKDLQDFLSSDDVDTSCEAKAAAPPSAHDALASDVVTKDTHPADFAGETLMPAAKDFAITSDGNVKYAPQGDGSEPVAMNEIEDSGAGGLDDFYQTFTDGSSS